jgi:hypothetical protein
MGTGVKSALAYSVFSASAAGFALFASRSHPRSVDGGNRRPVDEGTLRMDVQSAREPL